MPKSTDNPKQAPKPAQIKNLSPRPAPARAKKLSTSARDRFRRSGR